MSVHRSSRTHGPAAGTGNTRAQSKHSASSLSVSGTLTVRRLPQLGHGGHRAKYGLIAEVLNARWRPSQAQTRATSSRASVPIAVV